MWRQKWLQLSSVFLLNHMEEVKEKTHPWMHDLWGLWPMRVFELNPDFHRWSVGWRKGEEVISST